MRHGKVKTMAQPKKKSDVSAPDPSSAAGKDAHNGDGATNPDVEALLEEDDRLWNTKFAASKDTLTKMAAEARKQRQQGKTVPLETILDK
jgi:hypothetical protein